MIVVPLKGQLSNQLREDLARLAELEPILPATLLEKDRRLLTTFSTREFSFRSASLAEIEPGGVLRLHARSCNGSI
ncbi:MAG: hypothetical protein DRI30_07380 [Chloroflexi bacterium]|nr:MAG: hypothetical protein DRI30_07380 [Chloroflexota bacterium]